MSDPAVSRHDRRPRPDDRVPEGIILPSALYTVPKAKATLGLGAWAWRQLVRDGLRVIRIGGRAYVLSDDLLEFFRAKATERP